MPRLLEESDQIKNAREGVFLLRCKGESERGNEAFIAWKAFGFTKNAGVCVHFAHSGNTKREAFYAVLMIRPGFITKRFVNAAIGVELDIGDGDIVWCSRF